MTGRQKWSWKERKEGRSIGKRERELEDKTGDLNAFRFEQNRSRKNSFTKNIGNI